MPTTTKDLAPNSNIGTSSTKTDNHRSDGGNDGGTPPRWWEIATNFFITCASVRVTFRLFLAYFQSPFSSSDRILSPLGDLDNHP